MILLMQEMVFSFFEFSRLFSFTNRFLCFSLDMTSFQFSRNEDFHSMNHNSAFIRPFIHASSEFV